MADHAVAKLMLATGKSHAGLSERMSVTELVAEWNKLQLPKGTYQQVVALMDEHQADPIAGMLLSGLIYPRGGNESNPTMEITRAGKIFSLIAVARASQG